MAAWPGSEKSPDWDSEMPTTSGLPPPEEPDEALELPPPQPVARVRVATRVARRACFARLLTPAPLVGGRSVRATTLRNGNTAAIGCRDYPVGGSKSMAQLPLGA